MSTVGTYTERQRLRKFGLTVAVGFMVIGALSWWRHHAIAPAVLWAGAIVIGIPALVAPALLRRVERVWMTVGNGLGWINTRIILTALFYVVMTPAGLVMRLFRDPLDRELYETRTSYWNRRTATQFNPKSYERQF